MHRFNVRHHNALGKNGGVHVGHYALDYTRRNIVILRSIGMYRSVGIVTDVKQRRHIQSAYCTRGLVQKIGTAVASLGLHLYVQPGKLIKHGFTLADRETVKKVCHRLSVIGTGASADYYRAILTAIGRTERNFGEIEHIQHIGIAHFILKCEAYYIKLRDRVSALKCAERYVVLAHLLLHIDPWGKHTLTPYVRIGIERIVKYAHTEI